MKDVLDLVILGAGGHAREIADVVRACIDDGAKWNFVGFLDDDASKHGTELHEGPVLGGLAWLEGRAHGGLRGIAGIGGPASRRRVVANARERDLQFVGAVHPAAVLTKHVRLAEGVVITAGCVLTNDIEIGEHTHVNRMTTIGHDCRVGAYVHLAPGVVLSGNVTVEDGCDIGTRAAIIQGLRVGADSIVGAGAVVIRDLPPRCTAVGVPAKVISQRR